MWWAQRGMDRSVVARILELIDDCLRAWKVDQRVIIRFVSIVSHHPLTLLVATDLLNTVSKGAGWLLRHRS